MVLSNRIAKETSLELEKREVEKVVWLKGDFSGRRYARAMSPNGEGDSLLLCKAQTESGAKNFIELSKKMSDLNLLSPRIVWFCVSEKSYLIEDFGDEHLLDYRETKNGQDFYIKSLRWILDFQRKGIPLVGDFCFTKEKYKQELEATRKNFLEFYLRKNASGLDWYLNFSEDLIEDVLEEAKSVPCHRDFHSKNIMIKKGRLGIIDFQDMRLGHPLYDLVSLIDDPYAQLSIKTKNKLLSIFFNEQKIYSSYSDYLKAYTLIGLQRTLKAIGSYCHLYKEKKDPRCLRYIGNSMSSVESFFEFHPEYKMARKELRRVYYGH